jgi:hypothetical protein
MNVEIGTETLIFLFWEYLFGNFGILFLQCTAPVLSFISAKMLLKPTLKRYCDEKFKG